MNKWIIPSNLKRYDVIGAFSKLDEIDWSLNSINVKSGDLVYIYVGEPISGIKYCCEVTAINLAPEKDDIIDDHAFIIDDDLSVKKTEKYMRLKKLHEYEDKELTMSLLHEYGVNGNIQGARLVPNELEKYLNKKSKIDLIMKKLKVTEELEPDKYDGSYELMRETISAYSKLNDYSMLDYNDLNLVYHMCLGTWRLGIESKKKSINNSHLDYEKKERLSKKLDEIWSRAEKGEYQHQEPDRADVIVGMFSTGLSSFVSKTDKDSVQHFIIMCADILELDDDNLIFDRAELLFHDGFKGMAAGAASQVLHCLKPFTFPIMNKNMGYGNICEEFGVELKKKTDIRTYITNCRSIKAFRDKEFSFKNYRILDMAAWELDSMDNSEQIDYENNNSKEMKYWPSLEEYDPGLLKEDYKRCLSSSSKIKYESLDTIYRIYQLGNAATCKQIANVYGNTPSHYNINGQHVARWITEDTKCPLLIEDEVYKYWTVLFVGRETESSEEGAWVWKLREPLKEAVEELEQEGFFKAFDTEIEKSMDNPFNKNMILYGPPGTGKTYYSIIYAVAICTGESVESLQKKEYSEVLALYNELKEDNRIAFTTFHQSYGYEEFIEGIRPVLVDDDSEQNNLSYKLEPGVFKKICEHARDHEIVSANGSKVNTNSVVWKISLGGARDNKLKRDCFDNNCIRIGWDEVDAEITDYTEFPNATVERMLKNFVFEMQVGDIVAVLFDQYNIDAVGIVTGEYKWLDDENKYKRSRTVNWLVKDVCINVHDFGCDKRLSEMTVYKLSCDHEKLLRQTGVNIEKNVNNYVIIIDEINRGNIGKIFGELITLIEESKRYGADEAMEAILPYSGKSFSVPSNVYIIGTMNTADRSIALIDTALRRRFDFIEMMPQADVLRNLHADKVDDLDVAAMLETINQRIEYLFDREHTIGHAFFTSLKDDPSLEKLSAIFKKNIIPLLQEYFYEDYGKIQLILGDSGKSEEKYKFIKDNKIDKDLFKGDPEIDIDDLKYEINDEAFGSLESYKQIR